MLPPLPSVHLAYAGRSSIQAMERGLGLCRSCVMTSLYWNGLAFAPVNKTAAKKEAVVLRLETAFVAPDATPSLKYRGISYLRQNGFAATL